MNKILIIALMLLYIVSIISVIPLHSTVAFKTTNISVGNFPTASVYDPNNGYVYVADSGSNQVSVISLSSVVSTINVGSDPTAITFDKQNGLIYVANTFSNTISVINGTKVICNVTVGGGIGYSPVALICVNGLIYVANLNSYKAGVGIVSVINGTKVICNIQVECHPVCLTYDSNNGYIYVSDNGFASVSVIKGESVIATISVGQSPRQIMFDPYNGYVYVLNLESNSVSVISGTSVICTISINSPISVTYSPSYVYVSSLCTNTVYVISGTKIIDSITVCKDPVYVTYDSYDGFVYVANLASETVSIINSTEVINQVNTCKCPRFIVSTPSAVYVSDSGSSKVTEITTCKVAYYLTFKEEGLPSGKTWSVCVNGINETSTSNQITFVLPAGNYSYKVYSANYIPSPSQGTVDLTSNETIQITFTPIKYNLTFEETGLVAGTKWSVCVNGTVMSSTTNRICFLLPSGYYEYKVFNVTGYKVTPSSGYINLTHNITIKVNFTLYVVLYNVTFKEEGLPKGVCWTVCIDNENHTTTACYITITLPEGTYEYKIFSAHYMPNVTQGVINLTANKIVYLKFTPMNYTLTVIESGLPSGYMWSICINGKNYTTTANEINVTLPYGEYEVKAFSQYYVTSPQTVNLTENTELKFIFYPENFTITFEETGLPAGTKWTVCINGRNYTTTSSTLSITLPYGNYSYKLFIVDGYAPNVTEGTITLNKAESVSLTYKPVTTTVTTTTVSTTTTTTSTTPTTTTTPPSNTGLIIGIIVVIIIIIAVAAIFLLRRK